MKKVTFFSLLLCSLVFLQALSLAALFFPEQNGHGKVMNDLSPWKADVQDGDFFPLYADEACCWCFVHPRCFGHHGLIFVCFLRSVLLTCFFIGPQLLCFSFLSAAFSTVFSWIRRWLSCSGRWSTTVTPVCSLEPLVSPSALSHTTQAV